MKLVVNLKNWSTISPKITLKSNKTQSISPTLMLTVAKKQHHKTHNFSLPTNLQQDSGSGEQMKWMRSKQIYNTIRMDVGPATGKRRVARQMRTSRMRSCWTLHGWYLNDRRRWSYTRTKRGLDWVWLQRRQRRLGRATGADMRKWEERKKELKE